MKREETSMRFLLRAAQTLAICALGAGCAVAPPKPEAAVPSAGAASSPEGAGTAAQTSDGVSKPAPTSAKTTSEPPTNETASADAGVGMVSGPVPDPPRDAAGARGQLEQPAHWRGPARTRDEVERMCSEVSAGTKEARALLDWLGAKKAPGAGDIGSDLTKGSMRATAEWANLDEDPYLEGLVEILDDGAMMEQHSVYVLLDAGPGAAVRAAGFDGCSMPRGACGHSLEPVHDARFADVWIEGSGSVSLGNASIQVFNSAKVLTLQHGFMETIFADDSDGADEASTFRLTAEGPPRAIEVVRGTRVEKRLRWNGSRYQ